VFLPTNSVLAELGMECTAPLLIVVVTGVFQVDRY
jgi:hypothetical protein